MFQMKISQPDIKFQCLCKNMTMQDVLITNYFISLFEIYSFSKVHERRAKYKGVTRLKIKFELKSERLTYTN